MIKIFVFSLYSFSLSFMLPAYAHPGHDHNHWNAALLHYGFYISVAVMIAVVMYCMVLLLTADTADQGEQKKPKTQW